MLLVGLCRSGQRVLAVSPLLLAFALPPALGLALLVFAALAGLPSSDGGAPWFLVAFMAFFLGIGAYAFGRAAWAKQVSCERDGGELEVRAHQLHARVRAERARLRVLSRRFGVNQPVTVHLVVLEAPELSREVFLHAGLMAVAARAAARRLGRHLDVLEA